MRTKHIITIIIVVALIALIAIMLATVFCVREVFVACFDQEGNAIAVTEEYDISAEILAQFGGEGIMSLSKDDVLDWINSNYPDRYALAVVKEFPNTLVISIVVDCEAVYSIESGANTVYLNAFGYVIDAEAVDYQPFDITSAFDTPIVTSSTGQMLQFTSDNDNDRLQLIIDTVNTIWRLNYNYSDVTWLVQEIEFSTDNGIMTLTTQSGAQIVVYEPSTDLEDRLIDAFSVYANDTYNLQVEGAVITVLSTGEIRTSTD